MGHTLYIDGPEDGGEGVYTLVADTGEGLASHYCSDRSWARSDLVTRRTALQAEWRQQFGAYRVAFVADDPEMTRDELRRRNAAWHAAVEQGEGTA